MNLNNFKIGDVVTTGTSRNLRTGKVIKIIQPQDLGGGLVEPGGLVLDNEMSTFFVPAYDINLMSA